MIRQEHLGKIIEVTDIGGKIWKGKVSVITPAADSDAEENEIAIEHAGGLVNFLESEIESIKVISD